MLTLTDEEFLNLPEGTRFVIPYGPVPIYFLKPTDMVPTPLERENATLLFKKHCNKKGCKLQVKFEEIAIQIILK